MHRLGFLAAFSLILGTGAASAEPVDVSTLTCAQLNDRAAQGEMATLMFQLIGAFAYVNIANGTTRFDYGQLTAMLPDLERVCGEPQVANERVISAIFEAKKVVAETPDASFDMRTFSCQQFIDAVAAQQPEVMSMGLGSVYSLHVIETSQSGVIDFGRLPAVSQQVYDSCTATDRRDAPLLSHVQLAAD